MHTLLVVPTYNEAETIAEVLRGARAAVPDLEVVVVDDGSPDGTADIAAATGRDIGGVHVLRRGRRIGFGDAYRAGFSWGLQRGAEVLLQMDADLSHDPGALPELVAGLAGGTFPVVRFPTGPCIAGFCRGSATVTPPSCSAWLSTT